jgi:hypothetical protein
MFTVCAQHAELSDISALQHYPYLQNIDLSVSVPAAADGNSGQTQMLWPVLTFLSHAL